MLGLAMFAALVGLVPVASYGLIFAELYVLWHAAHASRDFQFGSFLQVCVLLVVLSSIMKTACHTAHVIPVAGQLINAAVAFFFILALNQVAQMYYM